MVRIAIIPAAFEAIVATDGLVIAFSLRMTQDVIIHEIGPIR
jgi:hypothetical protein